MAKVLPLNLTWNPQLELDGAAIPWNSTIREFQRRNAHYLVNTLEQPFLLPKDGCFEKCEAIGSLSFPEEGLGLGKFLDTPY